MRDISTHKLDVIDSISALVDSPAFGLRLKHTVTLSSKDTYPTNKGKRKYYLEEYIYHSNKYLDYNELISLKLNMNYFLILEPFDKKKYSFNVMITNRVLAMLVKTLKEMIELFEDEDKHLYVQDCNRRLMLNADYNSVSFKVKVYNQTLLFKPTILYDNDMELEGVELYIGKIENRFEFTLEQLYNFHHILDKLDLYTASLNLLNYIGRPDNNYYLNKVETSYRQEEAESKAISTNMEKRRKLGGKKEEENIFKDLKESSKKVEKLKIIIR